MMPAPASLTALPRWVLWREATRPGSNKPTKTPQNPNGKGPASSTDPATWATHEKCEHVFNAIPGFADGVGIVLGDLSDGRTLAGLDLDTCVDETGRVADWARAYLRTLRTYAEVSPSGRGLKLFFLVSAPDLADARRALGLADHTHGRKRTYGQSATGHPPAAELYLSGRYFTVTGNRWPEAPEEVATISRGGLVALGALMGDAQAADTPTANATPLPDDDGEPIDQRALDEKLRLAMRIRPQLAARWQGSTLGLRDTSRSGMDMSLAGMLKAAGFSYHEMRTLLCLWPYGAGDERAAAGDDRYFQRLWQRTAADAPEEAGEGAPSPLDARAESEAALWVDPDDFTVATIPPRPWVVKGYLMRGAVSLLTGPGSAGKSSLVVAWAVACALGKAVGAFQPPEVLRWLVYNVEDDRDEQRRRIAAALIRHGATPQDMGGRIVRCGPSTVGTLIHVDPQTGLFHFTAAWSALEALVIAHKVDVLVLDPLVELHTADENDNTALRAVVARLRSLAQAHNIAILLLHHSRKGAQAGDMDGARGASSIIGAVRVHMTVATMTKEEAEELGQPPEHRRFFFRVDGAKSNYAPAQEASWHELQAFDLANGEQVAAAIPWTPPHAAVTPDMESLALRILRDGRHGEPFSEGNRADASYFEAFTDAGIPRGLVAKTLSNLKSQRAVEVRDWHCPRSRKWRARLWVPGNSLGGWRDVPAT